MDDNFASSERVLDAAVDALHGLPNLLATVRPPLQEPNK